MKKKCFIYLLLFVGLVNTIYSQLPVIETFAIKQQLISDYNYLDTTSIKLDGNLTKAWAKIEISDGLWWLDDDKAKKLLKEAFELTAPEKDKKKVKRLVWAFMHQLTVK